jgi:hypothetical protein
MVVTPRDESMIPFKKDGVCIGNTKYIIKTPNNINSCGENVLDGFMNFIYI